jgi:hypothetical protein
MDIVEIRRANLRRWVAKNGTPVKERSLFSQLQTTGSFGERVARRIEDQYKMGVGYLDTADAPVKLGSGEGGGGLAESLKLTCETARELRLLSVYRLANQDQRRLIDMVVDEVGGLLDLRMRDHG